MKFLPTKLPGVTLVELDVFKDERGFFLETSHEKKYTEGGISSRIEATRHSP
jgi:dTDP-4-dehydrorhamnose 3,5-epimerase